MRWIDVGVALAGLAAACAGREAAPGIDRRETAAVATPAAISSAQLRDDLLGLLDWLEAAPRARAELEARLGGTLVAVPGDSDQRYQELEARPDSGLAGRVRLRAPLDPASASPTIIVLEAREGVPLRRSDFRPETIGTTVRLLRGDRGVLALHVVVREAGEREFAFDGEILKAVTLTRRR